jgi:hypothetical protein
MCKAPVGEGANLTLGFIFLSSLIADNKDRHVAPKKSLAGMQATLFVFCRAVVFRDALK